MMAAGALTPTTSSAAVRATLKAIKRLPPDKRAVLASSERSLKWLLERLERLGY